MTLYRSQRMSIRDLVQATDNGQCEVCGITFFPGTATEHYWGSGCVSCYSRDRDPFALERLREIQSRLQEKVRKKAKSTFVSSGDPYEEDPDLHQLPPVGVGYCWISRRHMLVSRIDRADWEMILAKAPAPWNPEEGLSRVRGLGASAADMYRRVYSRDRVSLKEVPGGFRSTQRYYPYSNQGPQSYLRKPGDPV